jgi:hypothetical protein
MARVDLLDEALDRPARVPELAAVKRRIHHQRDVGFGLLGRAGAAKIAGLPL